MRSRAATHATAVSVVSHGRHTCIFGIRRSDEACSTGGNSFLYFFDYRSGSYVASSPGQVVGTRLSQALAAGFVVYRLANGQLKFAEINVNGTKKVGGVPPGSGGALGRRVSWRELF